MKNSTLLALLAIAVVIGFGLYFFAEEREVDFQTEETTEEADVENAEEEEVTESDSEDLFEEGDLAGDQTDPAEDQAEPQTFTITYTNEGFDPANMEVNLGDTVRFLNQGDNSMWVASNPHPTHSSYPEFDQDSAGEVYEFIFDQAGSWGYHNHLVPNHDGTIVVNE